MARPALLPLLVLPLLLFTTACSEQVGAIRPNDANLDLTIDNVFHVPDTFPVTSIAASSDGDVALLSGLRPYLLVGRDGAYLEIGDGLLDKPVAVAYDGPNSVEVVDAARTSIFQFDNGRFVGERRLNVAGEITAAVRSDDAWVVLVRGSSGKVSLTQFALEDSIGFVRVPDLPVAMDGPVRLRALADGSVIIADALLPHRIIQVGVGDDVITRSVYEPIPDDAVTGLITPYWVAAGLVAVDDHLLYTVADLRSDDRRLFLIDQQGHVVRERRLTAPFAVATNVPGVPKVVALRNLNGQQLVYYGWRWRY